MIGGVWMGRREQIGRCGPLLYGGLIVAGLALGVLGLPAPLAVLGAAAVINGVALELCSLAWLSALQQLIPRHQLGRVSSASEFGSYALLPLGYGVAGWPPSRLGRRRTACWPLCGHCHTRMISKGCLRISSPRAANTPLRPTWPALPFGQADELPLTCSLHPAAGSWGEAPRLYHLRPCAFGRARRIQR
jgi:hypothetical protein